MIRLILITLTALAFTGCRVSEVRVSHPKAGVSVTMRFDNGF